MRSFWYLALFAVAALAGCASEAAHGVRQYSVAEFYRNIRYAGASFSHDGARVLVSSNRTGIFNAYAVPLAGGAPEPLTRSTTESVMIQSYFPADDRFLYASDRGGDELFHLYVREPDGSVRDLTPGDSLRAEFLRWAPDDRSFFVSTNERDPRHNDLYEYETDGYARRLLYKNVEGFALGPVSRDRRWLALVRVRTTSDQDVHLHDLRAGTTRHLTPHEARVDFSPEDFTPDGTALLLRSDEGREFAALVRHDLDSGARTEVLAPSWDVLSARYSRSGRSLVVTINEEARIRTRIFEAETMREAVLHLPEGSIEALRLSRDDRRIAFYHTDGSAPDELWGGRLGEAPRRLTIALDDSMNREDLVAPRHVRFASYDGVEVPGVLYVPHAATPRSRLPAVVLVHGGPGGQARIDYWAPTQALVNHGYVVFDINNRGSSGYGKTFFQMDDRKHGEADLGDVVAAKKMLAETGTVDTNRVAIVGGSYGGYMVLAALTLRPEAFAAGVDLFGISNWSRTLHSIPPWWEAIREALYAEMGDPATDSLRLRRISPLFHAENIRVPLMVLQGANDPRVLQRESDDIVAAVRKHGVPVEYVVFPDEGHGFRKKENEIRGYSAMLEFLDRHLKGAGRRS
jgi:dipeptidyl aminopeptidase/acylaminoacyl peptidase